MCTSVCPLALTTVCCSSSSSTATVSFGYSGSFSCAVARNQSGALSACTRGKNEAKASSNAAANMARLVLSRFGVLKNDLFFVIGFHRVEKRTQSCVVLHRKDHAIDHQTAFHFSLGPLLRSGNLVRDHGTRLDLF